LYKWYKFEGALFRSEKVSFRVAGLYAEATGCEDASHSLNFLNGIVLEPRVI
jgi:hypothetical protein